MADDDNTGAGAGRQQQEQLRGDITDNQARDWLVEAAQNRREGLPGVAPGTQAGTLNLRRYLEAENPEVNPRSFSVRRTTRDAVNNALAGGRDDAAAARDGAGAAPAGPADPVRDRLVQLASENREQFRGNTTNAGLNEIYQRDQGNNDHVRIGMGTIDAVRNQIRSDVQAERAADPAARQPPEGRLNGFEVPRGVDNNPTSTYFIRKHHYGEHLAFEGIDPPATMPGRREFQSLYNAQQTERERAAAQAPARGADDDARSAAPAAAQQPQDRDDRARDNPPDQPARDGRGDDDDDHGDGDDDRGAGGGAEAARKRGREAEANEAENDQQQEDPAGKRQRTEATETDAASATLDDSQSSLRQAERLLDDNDSQNSFGIETQATVPPARTSDREAPAPDVAAAAPAAAQGVARAQQPEPSALNDNSTRDEVENWLAARRLDNPNNIPNFRNNDELREFIGNENSDITDGSRIRLGDDAVQKMNANTIQGQAAAATRAAIDDDDERKPAAAERDPANNQQQPGRGDDSDDGSDDGDPDAGAGASRARTNSITGESLESLDPATLSVDGNSQSGSQRSGAAIDDAIDAAARDAYNATRPLSEVDRERMANPNNVSSRRDSIGSVGSLLDFPDDGSASTPETAQPTDPTEAGEASNKASEPRGRSNILQEMELEESTGYESPTPRDNDPFSQGSEIADPGTPGSLGESVRSWDETPCSASPQQRATGPNATERDTAPLMPEDWDNNAPINLQQRPSQRDLETLAEASELVRDDGIDQAADQAREPTPAKETTDADASEQVQNRAGAETNEASDASATTQGAANLGDAGRASSSESLSSAAEEGQREDRSEPVVEDEPDRGPQVQRDPDDDNNLGGSTAAAPTAQAAPQETETRGGEAQTSATQDQQSAEDAAEAELQARLEKYVVKNEDGSWEIKGVASYAAGFHPGDEALKSNLEQAERQENERVAREDAEFEKALEASLEDIDRNVAEYVQQQADNRQHQASSVDEFDDPELDAAIVTESDRHDRLVADNLQKQEQAAVDAKEIGDPFDDNPEFLAEAIAAAEKAEAAYSATSSADESTVDVDARTEPSQEGAVEEGNKRKAEAISSETPSEDTNASEQESGERDAKKARVEQSVAAESDQPTATGSLNIGERPRQTEAGEYAAIASNAEAEVRAAAEAGSTPPGRQTRSGAVAQAVDQETPASAANEEQSPQTPEFDRLARRLDHVAEQTRAGETSDGVQTRRATAEAATAETAESPSNSQQSSSSIEAWSEQSGDGGERLRAQLAERQANQASMQTRAAASGDQGLENYRQLLSDIEQRRADLDARSGDDNLEMNKGAKREASDAFEEPEGKRSRSGSASDVSDVARRQTGNDRSGSDHDAAVYAGQRAAALDELAETRGEGRTVSSSPSGQSAQQEAQTPEQVRQRAQDLLNQADARQGTGTARTAGGNDPGGGDDDSSVSSSSSSSSSSSRSSSASKESGSQPDRHTGLTQDTDAIDLDSGPSYNQPRGSVRRLGGLGNLPPIQEGEVLNGSSSPSATRQPAAQRADDNSTDAEMRDEMRASIENDIERFAGNYSLRENGREAPVERREELAAQLRAELDQAHRGELRQDGPTPIEQDNAGQVDRQNTASNEFNRIRSSIDTHRSLAQSNQMIRDEPFPEYVSDDASTASSSNRSNDTASVHDDLRMEIEQASRNQGRMNDFGEYDDRNRNSGRDAM